MNKLKSLLLILILVLPLAACDSELLPPGTEDQPFSPAVLLLITSVVVVPLAQVYKIYLEKGGKKPSSTVVNIVIFFLGAGLVLVFNAFNIFGSLGWPVWADMDSVLAWVGQVLAAAVSFLGYCVAAYSVMKGLIFKYVPGLMTAGMIKAKKAELKG